MDHIKKIFLYNVSSFNYIVLWGRCSAYKDKKQNQSTINIESRGNTTRKFKSVPKKKNDDDHIEEKKDEEKKEDVDIEKNNDDNNKQSDILLFADCELLISVLSSYIDVKNYEDLLNKAQNDEELKNIKSSLDKINEDRKKMIAEIDNKIKEVKISLIDLGYMEKFSLEEFTLEELNQLYSEIDKKIIDYFKVKIEPLIKKIEKEGENSKVSSDEKYLEYLKYKNTEITVSNVCDYFVKIKKFSEEIEQVWSTCAEIGDFVNKSLGILNDIFKSLEEIKEKFEEKDKLELQYNDLKSKNEKFLNNKISKLEDVQKCYDDVKNLYKNVIKVLDDYKKTKQKEDYIKKITECINNINKNLEEISKDCYGKKGRTIIKKDFANIDYKNLDNKEMKELVDLFNKLSKILERTEKFIKGVSEFMKKKSETITKMEELINEELKKNYIDIINTYQSNCDVLRLEFLTYVDVFSKICTLFKKIDKIIEDVQKLKNLEDDVKNGYINEIKVCYSDKLEREKISDELKKQKVDKKAYLEKINNIFDDIEKKINNIFTKAKIADAKLLFEKIKGTIKIKNGDEEICVLELLNNKLNVETKYICETAKVYKKINENNKKLLGYYDSRINDKSINEGFKSILKGIFMKLGYQKGKMIDVSFASNHDFKLNFTKISTKLNDFYKSSGVIAKSNCDYINLIYNLYINSLLNLEINYHLDKDKYKKGIKYEDLDIEFLIPLE